MIQDEVLISGSLITFARTLFPNEMPYEFQELGPDLSLGGYIEPVVLFNGKVSSMS